MKMLMAVSGALFVFYVLAHMYGNLKIFGGVAAFDEYAHHLRTMFTPILPYGGFLWLFRLVLILALAAHAWAAFYLWSKANGARTTRYVAKEAARATVKSRMMRWGGVALLLFLVWHLLQFTIVGVQRRPACGRQAARARSSSAASRCGGWCSSTCSPSWRSGCTSTTASGARPRRWAGPAAARRGGGRRPPVSVIALVTSIGFALPPLAILFGIVKGS